MKTSVCAATLLVLVLMSPSTSLASPESLNSAYAKYQKALRDNNNEVALEYAKLALELGEARLQPSDITLAYLKVNLAKLLDAEQEDKALTLFADAMELYESHYNDDAIELIDILLPYAKRIDNDKQAKSMMFDALDIAEDANNPLLLAEVQLATFERLVSTKLYSRKVSRLPGKALAIFQEHGHGFSPSQLKAEFLSAKVFVSNKKYQRASEQFESILSQLNELEFTHPYALASHAQLVEAYEELGDSDKATKHCIAIGAMRPWKDNQQQLPVYRAAPKYPMSALLNGVDGKVKVEVEVDANGFVSVTKVIDSRGGSQFVRKTVEAIEKWRYAPKFENGKPVVATTSVELEFSIQ
ncbi:energy transducer TonB [Shewanella maritima]|nr:energy transducer TonB [Shewanella maritima]